MIVSVSCSGPSLTMPTTGAKQTCKKCIDLRYDTRLDFGRNSDGSFVKVTLYARPNSKTQCDLVHRILLTYDPVHQSENNETFERLVWWDCKIAGDERELVYVIYDNNEVYSVLLDKKDYENAVDVTFGLRIELTEDNE